jgi:hypothetical protein
MTRDQAQQAMDSHTKVEAGEGEEHDTGYIHKLDGDEATVGWDSGVRTMCPIADLSVVCRD